MKIDFQKLKKSFYFAWQGLQNAFSKEQNLRIELGFFLIVCTLGIFLKISFFEWAWLILSCFFVLITELLNTALERLTDLVVDKHKTSLAKQTKDIAAAAVLLSTFQSVIAGLFIFLPKILL